MKNALMSRSARNKRQSPLMRAAITVTLVVITAMLPAITAKPAATTVMLGVKKVMLVATTAMLAVRNLEAITLAV